MTSASDGTTTLTHDGRKLYGTDDAPADQRAALADGRVPVAVYGLGKMGLPLAAVFADATGAVVGVDADDDVVGAVNRGESHVAGEPGLDDAVGRAVEAGWLRATGDGETAAARASLHVVIVPTLVDDRGHPDLSAVTDVAGTIASGLDPGDAVLAESTLPPGTCRDVLRPLLEREGDAAPGTFGVAFCPERTSSGRALEDVRGAYPKVVGGVDAESTRVAELVYDELVDNEVVAVSDATTAEAVKVFEGVYRDVNIALANELARHATPIGIDVVEAIDAANTQPYCDLHDPGAGVGGHCIPYYPRFLVHQFDADSRLLETARAVNEAMPVHTATRALDALCRVGVAPHEASTLVLGLTYRPGVAEIRATPALPIVRRLARANARVVAHDPVVTAADDRAAFEAAGATVATRDAVERDRFDAAVLVTAQESFEGLDVPALGPDDRPLVVVDGRRALAHLRDRDDVVYEGIGLDVRDADDAGGIAGPTRPREGRR